MICIRPPRPLINGQNLILSNCQHYSIRSMPHSLNPISEVIVSAISQVLFAQQFAFKLKIFDKRKAFHVLIVFQKDVVLNFHAFSKMIFDSIIIPPMIIYLSLRAQILYNQEIMDNYEKQPLLLQTRNGKNNAAKRDAKKMEQFKDMKWRAKAIYKGSLPRGEENYQNTNFISNQNLTKESDLEKEEIKEENTRNQKLAIIENKHLSAHPTTEKLQNLQLYQVSASEKSENGNKMPKDENLDDPEEKNKKRNFKPEQDHESLNEKHERNITTYFDMDEENERPQQNKESNYDADDSLTPVATQPPIKTRANQLSRKYEVFSVFRQVQKETNKTVSVKDKKPSQTEKEKKQQNNQSNKKQDSKNHSTNHQILMSTDKNSESKQQIPKSTEKSQKTNENSIKNIFQNLLQKKTVNNPQTNIKQAEIIPQNRSKSIIVQQKNQNNTNFSQKTSSTLANNQLNYSFISKSQKNQTNNIQNSKNQSITHNLNLNKEQFKQQLMKVNQTKTQINPNNHLNMITPKPIQNTSNFTPIQTQNMNVVLQNQDNRCQLSDRIGQRTLINYSLLQLLRMNYHDIWPSTVQKLWKTTQKSRNAQEWLQKRDVYQLPRKRYHFGSEHPALFDNRMPYQTYKELIYRQITSMNFTQPVNKAPQNAWSWHQIPQTWNPDSDERNRRAAIESQVVRERLSKIYDYELRISQQQNSYENYYFQSNANVQEWESDRRAKQIAFWDQIMMQK